MANVSCPCGATFGIDLASSPEEAACPECRETLQLVIQADPVTKKKRVGILVSMGAVQPKKGRGRGTTRTPATAAQEEYYKSKCTCGAQVLVDPKSVDSVHSCTNCGAGFTAILKQGRTPGLHTLVLMPIRTMSITKEKTKTTVKPAPAPAPAAPAKAAAASRPAAGPSMAAASPAKENLLMMSKGDIGAQEIKSDEGESQTILCHCGEELALLGNFHREITKCAACGLAFRVFAAVHPKTKKAMAITLPRDTGSGKGK
jgi:hypothetical protein